MKNIWTIMKKELARVFKDMRLVLTIFILPGLMIYGIYMLMGDAMNNMNNEGTTDTAEIYVVNESQMFMDILNLKDPDTDKKLIDLNANFHSLELSELDAKKELLMDEKSDIDYIIVFDDDFDNRLMTDLVPEDTYVAPILMVYYNPTSNLGTLVNEKISSAISVLETNALIHRINSPFLINLQSELIYDERTANGQMFAMLLPFLILAFLFSGAMSVGPESIAGEKERGTIATLLITPTKRSHIALGKIISLSILSFISAVSSFVGVVLSLPKIMGSASVNASIYGFAEYAGILLVLVATVLLLVSVISIVSAYAKNIKEASMYVMPLMILSMLVGITSMFSQHIPTNELLYLIPVYNSVQVMTGIFSFSPDFELTFLFITVISNIVYTLGFTFVLTRMFNSEKMMFSK